jgi:predicted Ser/Thr protein kinase
LLRDTDAVRVIPGRNLTKAEVVVYAWDGGRVAVKDYACRPLPIRLTVGRYLIRREAAVYRAAQGVQGIPRFFGRLGPCALAVEWIEGRTLSGCTAGTFSAAVFDRLEEIVAALHLRGVALADLHHRDVLIGENADVHVIDLAAGYVLGHRPSRLRRALFERLRDQDLVSLARMRARFTGGDPDAAVEALGGRAAAWHRRGRRIKTLWNRLRGRIERA